MRKLRFAVTSLVLVGAFSAALAQPVTSLGNLVLVKKEKNQKIGYEAIYKFDRTLRPGQHKKVQNGTDGFVVEKSVQLFAGGKLLKEVELGSVTTRPVPAIFHMGPSGVPTSRGSFTRGKVMRVEATAYLPTDGSSAGLTASGRRAQYGVIAVDPRVIPLGSLVLVEGYGFAIAADTGGAIKGNKIDVCLHDPNAVRQWGRRMVTIHIFREKVEARVRPSRR
jgi:3D (Asp-Asp-Asp) domain-containing protein